MEYVGELLRKPIADIRERHCAAKGIYFFTLDSDWVLDATHAGNITRYVNHSCRSPPPPHTHTLHQYAHLQIGLS